MFWLTRIRADSMAPALPDGSVVLTRSLSRAAPLQRGDIVILMSHEYGERMVKRIIGLPGESVTIRTGVVFIDGHMLPEAYASPCVFSDTYRAPPGHYFLLGDHREASSDSRTWRDPYIAREAIIGRVVAWPWA